MTTAPIILVPGFWLGAWAWDEVAAVLRADGHAVTALTLPGLESRARDRSAISLEDHVDAIATAVTKSSRPVVLVLHSGASIPGYVVSDRLPDQIAAMVYIDHGPATAALDPECDQVELPLPPREEMDPDDVRGMSDEAWERFQERAVPEPGGPIREAPVLSGSRRRHIPSMVVCTSRTADQLKALIPQGWAWLSGLSELTDVTYVDLPTHHWPMWSRPEDLAGLLGDLARRTGSR